jgi:hypothetical protein
MNRRHIILLCALSLSSGAAAQENRLGVYVNHSGSDRIGVQIAYRLREELAKSARFKSSLSADDAFYVASFITMNPDNEEIRSNYSVYSISLTIYNKTGFNYYVTSYVGTCGSSKINECAGNLIAIIDNQNQILVDMANKK